MDDVVMPYLKSMSRLSAAAGCLQIIYTHTYQTLLLHLVQSKIRWYILVLVQGCIFCPKTLWLPQSITSVWWKSLKLPQICTLRWSLVEAWDSQSSPWCFPPSWMRWRFLLLSHKISFTWIIFLQSVLWLSIFLQSVLWFSAGIPKGQIDVIELVFLA